VRNMPLGRLQLHEGSAWRYKLVTVSALSAARALQVSSGAHNMRVRDKGRHKCMGACPSGMAHRVCEWHCIQSCNSPALCLHAHWDSCDIARCIQARQALGLPKALGVKQGTCSQHTGCSVLHSHTTPAEEPSAYC
jgi:hypothetical protein